MAYCNDLDTTAVPQSFGSDNPPPPAYIRKKATSVAGSRMVDKCNKALWIRYQPEGGRIEVNGSVVHAMNWPENVDRYSELIVRAANKHVVPAAWIAGFIAQESRGSPGAYSPASAIGLMQLLKSTGKWLSDPAFPNRTDGHVGPTPEELTDPELNIELGTKLLAHLMDKYNDNIVYVAGAYNHGSAECGAEVGIKDPTTGVRKQCPTPPNPWGLITNCGYVDGIIHYTNRAMLEGYSGLKEIYLDSEEMDPVETGGPSLLSILLGVGAGAGAVAAWRFLR